MASIVSQIVVVLANRVLSDGSVNWPHVIRRSYPQKPVLLYFLSLDSSLRVTCVVRIKFLSTVDTTGRERLIRTRSIRSST